MRYLGYTSLEQVDRLTVPEYELLMEGVRLRETDRDLRQHLAAWLSREVQATRRSGKRSRRPVYQRFEQFYDYEAALARARSVRGPRTPGRFDRLIEHLREEGQTDGGTV